MAKLFPPAYVFSKDGKPLAGGGVVFYENGTTTLKDVFTDAALTVAATNSATTTPKGQPLNGAGQFSQGDLYGSNTYTIAIFDSAGGIVDTRDDFNPSTFTDLDSDSSITMDTDDQALITIDSIEAVIFGWQSITDTGFLTLDPPAFTADATENTHRVAILNTRQVTIPAGVTPLVSTIYILEPNINAAGTVTTATTIYVKGAPTEGGTNNYAVWIDDGDVKVDSKIIAATIEATGDTTSGDNASMGYTASEGLILTGQGSSNDVTIKNDADANVITIATGTTNVDIVGDVTALTVNADGDTSAGDSAAMGYTSSDGLVLTGQGSSNDITLRNDAGAVVMKILTGTTIAEFPANGIKLASGATVTGFSDDTTLAGDSQTESVTEHAAKTYADDRLVDAEGISFILGLFNG